MDNSKLEIKAGQQVAVKTVNGTITGTVKGAGRFMISVDQGGVTAILRYDVNLNSWLFGKAAVTIMVYRPSIQPLLQVISEKADELGWE